MWNNDNWLFFLKFPINFQFEFQFFLIDTLRQLIQSDTSIFIFAKNRS